MVIVDTSVIIQMLRGEQNNKVALFRKIVDAEMPYAISAYTYMEILRGARDDKNFRVLKDYLSTQEILHLPSATVIYERVGKLFFDLRRKGVTPRGAIDVFIALTAIHHKCALLHNDKDYDNMAKHLDGLVVYNG